ncbi:hypothetical protein SI65_02436 [Aspergillus cristatus]|uniref:Uncharacterized protein n=1 Tax=Aspergillus cristatus TaxID=573508 RepID=A0A1E3BKT9_ASPCR|nr:hypothetical protein SI65_02436 [Aspergillus cristatus]
MEAYHRSRRACHNCFRPGTSSSTSSEASARSKSTAPTIYSDHRPTYRQKEKQPVDPEDDDEEEVLESVEYGDDDEVFAIGPKDSASTYTSTVPEDIPEEEPRYVVVDRRPEFFPTDPLPSNPLSFGDLFPSSRRLLIRHDDSTLDGNMNLRVDTMVPHRAGFQQDITLFHLRMYDLFSRKFSFRRYCRDSGREVCHTERKRASSPGLDKRLTRSWSTALASLRSNHGSPERRRRDSGSKSMNDAPVVPTDEEFDQDDDDREQMPFVDTTMMEFSNYAHVEVKRGISKHYEFEYWTTKYQWRRQCRKEGNLRDLVSYYLVNMQTSKTVAHLVPDIMTPMEAIEEEDKGGWIPPSSLWISESSEYERMTDVADAIVATGLIVLVDDCIRRRWHSSRSAHLLDPMRAFSSKSIDLLGPKRLIDEVFHHRGSA